MKVIDVEQGSPEWHTARCGIPTASNFDKIVDISGKQSRQRMKYLYQLAGEIITQKPEETYQNNAMLRGIEMESEARNLYELITGKAVTKSGLCVYESDVIFGASPDGMVGEAGLIEIKCPMIHTHISYLLNGGLPEEYFQQTQGQLLVTGRKWVDFVSYYPGIKPHIVRVKPDKKFLGVLLTELTCFCRELDEIVDKIK